MGLNSQQIGKKWEKEIMDRYYKRGWQPFKLPTELVGTCFDIILIKASLVVCVEAKHITSDKLYYKGSGISKKRDELNHLLNHSGIDVNILVNSDATGKWFTTWSNARHKFREKGYIEKSDCTSLTWD